MKNTKGYLVVAFIIAFSVLLIIPLWAIYGVLLPEEHGGHGGEMVMAAEFQNKMTEYIEEYSLPDGSVEHLHEGSAYIMASQYTFTPATIRMGAGESYNLQFLSSDVVHSISVQMDGTSYNAVVMPMMVTSLEVKPLQPGTYLVNCNEYCGIGHDYMYFTLIVEEGDGHEEDEHEEEHTD
jgi:heme/copper-type cytochrome/quinol oxidase subunit 2